MRIHETQTASCPFSAAIEFGETFFVACDKGRPVNAPTEPVELMPSCQVMVDSTDFARRHDALNLSWSHHASFLPPDFYGSLTVRPASGESELTLEASYDSRAVPPKNMLDNVAGLAIAHAAMRSLLQQIVSHVESEWRQFADDCPSIATCNARSVSAPTRRPDFRYHL
jgi:hypothetical protein